MTKYFLLLLIVVLAIWYAKRPARTKPRAEAKVPESGDEMVRCAHCDIYLPHAEAVHVQGRAYCSVEHRRLGEGGRG